MRIFLALRALFFVLLLPGTVAGYIPYRILRSRIAFEFLTLGFPALALPF